ncbi:MAG: Pyruvate/2-oxoglutarate dehydrogenase complex, dehydrogenase component, eukaryotic type [Gammaproteobacteria bacterium]|jgi:TPP-dependent pyruvate/acetoin dehydrogenase alpha subunit|nr:Pyruvate/2-oxoglutarate dehydrogenase complex, dehydrogenase component, eukaryotic type [Gammaproteobacteria bacterium]
MKPTPKQRIWMYESMLKSRLFDDALFEAYWEGKKPVFHMGKGPLPGEMHQSFGQEPTAVGVCAHLGPDDAVGAGHRPHHVAIARGVNLKRMAAEVFGKKTGLSGGRGGHMHLYDNNVNFFCSGIIAEGMGPGAGIALARKMQKKPGIAVAYNGDGAVNQGAFHEVMNMAALWKLPFVCVIEDNNYAVSVTTKESTVVPAWKRAAGYDCPGEYVKGNDPDLIFEAAARAVQHAREGKGPSILEIETERLHGHFIGDSAGYRSKDEVAGQKDPIPVYRKRLLDEKALTAADMETLEANVKEEVDAALKFARDSEYPAPTEALDRVYA